MGDTDTFLEGEDLTEMGTLRCFGGEILADTAFTVAFFKGDFCFFSTTNGSGSSSSELRFVPIAEKALLRTGEAFLVSSFDSTGSGASLIESFYWPNLEAY
jgi:hypothetical protein